MNLSPEDIGKIENLISAHMEKARIERNEVLHNELRPIREFMMQVKVELYGQPGETGISKMVVRHDTLLWVLVGFSLLALAGIFILLIR